MNPVITVEEEGNHIEVKRPNDERQNRAMHGLYRALIHNMVVGVSAGYKKEMELVGRRLSCHIHRPGIGTVIGLLTCYLHQASERGEGRGQRQSVTRTRSSFSKAPTSSFSVRYAPRFAHSASLSLTKAKVSSLLGEIIPPQVG